MSEGQKQHSIFEGCSWIWEKNPLHNENHWINVRRTFVLSEVTAGVFIHISVDTDYCLWINGQFVSAGQFSDYPGDKHYDSIQVDEYLTVGKNCIAILAYYQGISTNRYITGKAGLIFSLHVGHQLIGSDQHCRVRTSSSFLNGSVPLVTKQLGPTITYDAGKEDDWTKTDYRDSLWLKADVIAEGTKGYWKSLAPRPLPRLELHPIDAEVKIRGEIQRTGNFDGTVAQIMDRDILMPETEPHDINLYAKSETADGCFAVFDLGKECFGYLNIELTAAKGTVVDIAHGEHLADNRIRCCIDGRNFADRYICADGRQKWLMPVRRLGCRYLQLHFTKMSGSVQIHRVGLLQASYPVSRKGSFECNIELHNRIYELCSGTLELCMHEHYEDCPWREQALYSADARNQALCGYYLFGEYNFPETSLRLLGKGIRSDGFLSLCAMTDRTLTIPSFSMIWITSVWEYSLYSGRKNLCLEFADQIDSMLEKYISQYDDRGLMTSPSGEDYWNFYEWAPALNGMDKQGSVADANEIMVESCLNLFLLEAMEAAENIFKFIRRKDRADYFHHETVLLRKAISEKYIHDEFLPACIYPEAEKKLNSQLIESLAIVNRVLSPADINNICREIAFNESLEQATLCSLLYVYKAVMDDKSPVREWVLRDIHTKWGRMLDNGATSCWETIKGADDFNGAGSLCHGWSTVPLYMYQAYVLGIKPLTPGFKAFEINPCVQYFERAKGSVPTPYGLISVEWNRKTNTITVRHPEVIHPHIAEKSSGWDFDVEPYVTAASVGTFLEPA